MGNYGKVPSVAGQALIWGTTLAYLALVGLIIVAIRRVPKTPLSAVLGLLGLYQLAIVFITFGNTRFRLPVMLVGMILAAWTVEAEDSE